MNDFDYVPFNQEGGSGRASAVLGPDLQTVLDEMNEVLSG